MFIHVCFQRGCIPWPFTYILMLIRKTKFTFAQSNSHQEGTRRGVTQVHALFFSSCNVIIPPGDALDGIKLTEQHTVFLLLPGQLHFDDKFTSM